MINAEFFVTEDNNIIVGFHIYGHSGMAESGNDIICAFVSSAAYMAANTITDIIHAKAEVTTDDGDMYVMVEKKDAASCRDVLAGLKLHLVNTEEQYPQFLQVNYTEV